MEVEIHIPVGLAQQEYIDKLILAIADCGYAPYHNKEYKYIGFTGDKEELVTELKSSNK